MSDKSAFESRMWQSHSMFDYRSHLSVTNWSDNRQGFFPRNISMSWFDLKVVKNRTLTNEPNKIKSLFLKFLNFFHSIASFTTYEIVASFIEYYIMQHFSFMADLRPYPEQGVDGELDRRAGGPVRVRRKPVGGIRQQAEHPNEGTVTWVIHTVPE